MYLHINPLKPLVSVVIPAFNEEKFISKTLQSLLKQNFKNFEVIVVDNNSTDKTAELAKSFGAIVLFEPCKGISNARQKGFLSAKGTIIASTDADTILPPNWLSHIIQRFEKDKNLIGIGGIFKYYSGSIIVRLVVDYFLYPLLLLDKICSGGWIFMGSNFSVKKQAFLDIGGFNTELVLNEDVELSYRLRKIGKIKLDPNLCVKTSGRRYQHGFISGLKIYVPAIIMRICFKKYNQVKKLSCIRKEPTSTKIQLFFIIIFLLLLFMFAYLKTSKSIKERINLVNKIISM